MKKHIEKEYKITLDKETYHRLLNDLRIDKTYIQINHYYSAPKDTGIRIREKEGKYEFTIKVKDKDRKIEYNIDLDDNDINDPKVKALLKELDITDIRHLGDLKTTRSDINLPKAILSLDKSEFLGITDHELEYELKDADIDDIDTLKEVLKMTDIKVNENTKYGNFIKAMTGKVAIFCADGLEECEALITMDLLKRAGLYVDLVSMNESDDILSSHDLRFKADKNFRDIDGDAYDVLVLPGGLKGTKTLSENKELIALLKKYKDEGKIIAAICAAPSIFVDNDLVRDDHFTVYPGFENGKRSTGNKAEIDDNVITGEGVGAAFEFSYAIIAKLLGEDKAEAIYKETQYI